MYDSLVCRREAPDSFPSYSFFNHMLKFYDVQTKERSSTDEEISAEKIANSLLNEARTLRTKDNTSIIFLDFDTTNRILSCKIDS